MSTEQQLKSDCTPDIIKRMVELAEGFELIDKTRTEFSRCTYEYHIMFKNQVWNIYEILYDTLAFSTLIHRAVEGWNNNESTPFIIEVFSHMVRYNEKLFRVKNYQPKSLTHAECAMLHCLLDVFKQEERDEQ